MTIPRGWSGGGYVQRLGRTRRTMGDGTVAGASRLATPYQRPNRLRATELAPAGSGAPDPGHTITVAGTPSGGMVVWDTVLDFPRQAGMPGVAGSLPSTELPPRAVGWYWSLVIEADDDCTIEVTAGGANARSYAMVGGFERTIRFGVLDVAEAVEVAVTSGSPTAFVATFEASNRGAPILDDLVGPVPRWWLGGGGFSAGAQNLRTFDFNSVDDGVVSDTGDTLNTVSLWTSTHRINYLESLDETTWVMCGTTFSGNSGRWRVTTVDASDPEDLQVIATVAIDSSTEQSRARLIDGRWLYWLDHLGSRLVVVDLADPADPQVTSVSNATYGQALVEPEIDLARAGVNYLAFSRREGDDSETDPPILQTINITTRMSPTLSGSVASPYTYVDANSLTVYGLAFRPSDAASGILVWAIWTLGEGTGAVHIINVSSPGSPSIAHTMTGLSGQRFYWASLHGTNAFVTSEGSGFGTHWLDLSSPTSPVRVGDALPFWGEFQLRVQDLGAGFAAFDAGLVQDGLPAPTVGTTIKWASGSLFGGPLPDP